MATQVSCQLGQKSPVGREGVQQVAASEHLSALVTAGWLLHTQLEQRSKLCLHFKPRAQLGWQFRQARCYDNMDANELSWHYYQLHRFEVMCAEQGSKTTSWSSSHATLGCSSTAKTTRMLMHSSNLLQQAEHAYLKCQR